MGPGFRLDVRPLSPIGSDASTRARGKQVFRTYAVSSRKCINSLTHAQRTSVYCKCAKLGHFGATARARRQAVESLCA